jgi:hypothetical protein
MLNQIKDVKHSRLAEPALFTFIIMGCMFLASADFINRYYYCVFIAFFCFIGTPCRKISSNSTLAVLILFSMSILLFDPTSQTKFTYILKPFVYPICYLMGASLFKSRSASDNALVTAEYDIHMVVYVLTAGTMGHFLLNMFINMSSKTRHVIDFWTRAEMSATGQATLAALMVGVIAAFFFSDASKKKKIIAAAAIISILGYNLILAGRTLFVLIAILVVFAFVHRSVVTKRKFFKTLVFITLIAVAIVYLYNENIFGLRTSVESSNFYYRFFKGEYTQEINRDNRMEHKMAYIRYFWDYPFGGNQIRQLYGHYAHDLYLDTYDEAGIFALLTITIYIISSFLRMVRTMRSKQLSFETRQLVACIYVVINIQFLMEPILAGMPWLLASYCFIDGAVTYLLSEEKRLHPKIEYLAADGTVNY